MNSAVNVVLIAIFVATTACGNQGQKSNPSPSVDDEIAQIKQQLKQTPNSSSLHGQLSAMLAAKWDWDGSDKEMKAAMRLDPNNPILYIEAAQRYRAQNEIPKALEMLKHAVGIDPKNPLSHFNLGLMYNYQSEREKAHSEFHEAQRLIDTLSLPSASPDVRNRIIKGPRNEIWYHDQFGKDYLLNDILGPLKKQLAQTQ